MKRIASFIIAAGIAWPTVALADPTKRECIDANADAQVQQKAGKLRAAQTALHTCSSAACPGAVKDDCAQRLDALSALVPSLLFEAKDTKGSDLPKIQQGAPCTISQILGCDDNLTCTATSGSDGKCEPVVGLNDACIPTLIGSTCYFGLICASGTCKEPTYGPITADCNTTDKLCAKSYCDVGATNKCVAYVATDGMCDGLKQCDPSKDACDFNAMKCKAAGTVAATNICR